MTLTNMLSTCYSRRLRNTSAALVARPPAPNGAKAAARPFPLRAGWRFRAASGVLIASKYMRCAVDNAALLNIEPFRPMLPPVTANSVAGCASPDDYGAKAPTPQQALFLCLLSMCAPEARCLSMADRVGRPLGLPGSIAPVLHTLRDSPPNSRVQAVGSELLNQLWGSTMSSTSQVPSANLPTVLSFEGVELKIIDRNGLPWITSGDLGRALGYKRGGDQVVSIYRQHAHEFCEAMTTTIPLREFSVESALKGDLDLTADSAVKGNPNIPVRIFSPRGAHLIAMFARTAKAAAFRRWVLDVLEGLAVPAAQPVVENPLDSLRLTRVLFTLDGYGRPQAMAVPDDACMLRVADVPALMADPAATTRTEVEAVALAALQRVYEESGTHGLRNLLATLDENYLLVLESELIYSLYGSPTVWNAAKRGGKHA